MKQTFLKALVLLLCGVICTALLAGCGEEQTESASGQSSEVGTEDPVSSEPESEPVSEESEEPRVEKTAWDLKPFDWDAVIGLDQTETISYVTMDAINRYHSFNMHNFVKIWVDDPDALTWVQVSIPKDDYSEYVGEKNIVPAKERAAHIIELLEDRNRRYAYISYDEMSYTLIAPISYHEIEELNIFGGYFFRCVISPRNEESVWYNYEGEERIIYG